MHINSICLWHLEIKIANIVAIFIVKEQMRKKLTEKLIKRLARKMKMMKRGFIDIKSLLLATTLIVRNRLLMLKGVPSNAVSIILQLLFWDEFENRS